MTETAVVLFVRATGTVLATVTRTSDPAAAPPAAELAGERFPVRDDGGDVVVEVAAAALESGVVPFDSDLLLEPQKCGVTVDKEGKTESAALLSQTVEDVTLDPEGVTVSVEPAVSEDTPVWVQLDSGRSAAREHEVLTGHLSAGNEKVELPKTLQSGDYGVLALVKGLVPAVSEKQVGEA